jgi:cell division protein FtsQ
MRLLKRRKEGAGKATRARRPRRWVRRLLVAAGLMLLAAGAGTTAWLVHSGALARTIARAEQYFFAWTADLGFAVADVTVEGRERASREAILSALGVARGTPILAIDPAAAKRQLETIPWIRSASVERRLPDALHIRLVERQPMALWQRQGKLVLIDRDGVVVPSEHLESFGNLIVLVGPDAPSAGAALLDMLAGEPLLQPHVAAAVRVGGRRWTLRLDTGIDVALPEDDAAGAWHRLAELERSDGILERNVEMIDMRLPDRLVLRTPPAESVKSPAKKGRQPGNNT